MLGYSLCLLCTTMGSRGKGNKKILTNSIKTLKDIIISKSYPPLQRDMGLLWVDAKRVTLRNSRLPKNLPACTKRFGEGRFGEQVREGGSLLRWVSQ